MLVMSGSFACGLLAPLLFLTVLQEACTVLSSLLMTIDCLTLHTADLQFAECACLLSPCPAPSVTGCWRQLGKQHERQPSPRAKGLAGSVSAHSWLKYPVLECRETPKKLQHIWVLLSTYTDWISKHRDRIWHFSFNN